MSEIPCTYDGRDEMLVAYLYDELSAGERATYDAHVAGCDACRLELAELRAVRVELAGWAPPERARVLTFTPPGARAVETRGPVLSRLAAVPAWAQVAAAMLVLGVAAGIANLQITYGAEGLMVRTGWMAAGRGAAPDMSVAAAPDMNVGPAGRRGEAAPNVGPSFSSGAISSGATSPGGIGAGGPSAAPWRADLAALERDLRAEVRKASASAPTDARADDDTMRRVRALIEASERNQRRELALRVAEMAREVQVQRVADLQRIQRNLTVIENTTGGAIVRQGKLLNNLAVRVSQQQ